MELGDDIFDKKLEQICYASPLAHAQHLPWIERLTEVCESKNKSLTVLDKVPSIEELKSIYPDRDILLILDDLLSFSEVKGLTEISSLHAHHQGISTVYALQNPYQQTNKCDIKTISRNLTTKVLMYQTSDF